MENIKIGDIVRCKEHGRLLLVVDYLSVKPKLLKLRNHLEDEEVYNEDKVELYNGHDYALMEDVIKGFAKEYYEGWIIYDPKNIDMRTAEFPNSPKLKFENRAGVWALSFTHKFPLDPKGKHTMDEEYFVWDNETGWAQRLLQKFPESDITIKTTWSIEDCFRQFRYIQRADRGLGEIYLTKDQQQGICAMIEKYYTKKK